MKKVALLVGVEHYEDRGITPLRFAGADVAALSDCLQERCAFDQVHVLAEGKPESTPSKGRVLDALSNLAVELRPDDLFLFFFSGHGVEINGQSYLYMRDSRQAYAEDTGLSMRLLRGNFGRLEAGHRALLIDACRNDPRAGKGDSDNCMGDLLTKDIRAAAKAAPGDHPNVTALLAACQTGQRAYEWPAKGHGVFTHFLLEGMRGGAWDSGALDFQRLAAYTQKEVRRWSKNTPGVTVPQEPWFEQFGVAEPIVLARHAAGARPEANGGSDHASVNRDEPAVNEEEEAPPPPKKERKKRAATTKRKEKASDHRTAALRRDELAEAALERAVAAFADGRIDETIDACSEAILNDPTNAEAYGLRGNARLGTKQQPQAMDDFTQAIELGTDDAWVFHNRGMLFGYQGDFGRAVEDFDKAIDLTPDDAIFLNSRGEALVVLGEPRRAIDDFERAVKLDPSFKTSSQNLAKAKKKLAEAEADALVARAKARLEAREREEKQREAERLKRVSQADREREAQYLKEREARAAAEAAARKKAPPPIPTQRIYVPPTSPPRETPLDTPSGLRERVMKEPTSIPLRKRYLAARTPELQKQDEEEVYQYIVHRFTVERIFGAVVVGVICGGLFGLINSTGGAVKGPHWPTGIAAAVVSAAGGVFAALLARRRDNIDRFGFIGFFWIVLGAILGRLILRTDGSTLGADIAFFRDKPQGIAVWLFITWIALLPAMFVRCFVQAAYGLGELKSPISGEIKNRAALGPNNRDMYGLGVDELKHKYLGEPLPPKPKT